MMPYYTKTVRVPSREIKEHAEKEAENYGGCVIGCRRERLKACFPTRAAAEQFQQAIWNALPGKYKFCGPRRRSPGDPRRLPK